MPLRLLILCGNRQIRICRARVHAASTLLEVGEFLSSETRETGLIRLSRARSIRRWPHSAESHDAERWSASARERPRSCRRSDDTKLTCDIDARRWRIAWHAMLHAASAIQAGRSTTRPGVVRSAFDSCRAGPIEGSQRLWAKTRSLRSLREPLYKSTSRMHCDKMALRKRGL
jgi:hypothetical protein